MADFPKAHYWLQNVITCQAYIKRYIWETLRRHSIENTFALKLMFKKIAESVMQPMSFSRLANIVTTAGVKVGKSTVINYAEYAKDAWLITPVSNFAGKLVGKETNPKYYFTDNGILNLFPSATVAKTGWQRWGLRIHLPNISITASMPTMACTVTTKYKPVVSINRPPTSNSLTPSTSERKRREKTTMWIEVSTVPS